MSAINQPADGGLAALVGELEQHGLDENQQTFALTLASETPLEAAEAADIGQLINYSTELAAAVCSGRVVLAFPRATFYRRLKKRLQRPKWQRKINGHP